MLGGYSNGYIMRALYVLPLCCMLRLSDGAPVLCAWWCGCVVALDLSARLSLFFFSLLFVVCVKARRVFGASGFLRLSVNEFSAGLVSAVG